MVLMVRDYDARSLIQGSQTYMTIEAPWSQESPVPGMRPWEVGVGSSGAC